MISSSRGREERIRIIARGSKRTETRYSKIIIERNALGYGGRWGYYYDGGDHRSSPRVLGVVVSSETADSLREVVSDFFFSNREKETLFILLPRNRTFVRKP
jgi:hypothetical protein